MQFPYDTVAVAGETVEVVYVDFSTGLGFVLLVGSLWRTAKPHRHAHSHVQLTSLRYGEGVKQ